MAQVEIPSYKRMGGAKQEPSKKPNSTPRLKKEDYITAAIAFFVARTQMIGSMSPFAMAFFCASYTQKRMPLTFLCALVGHLSTGMGIDALGYLISMGIFSLVKMAPAISRKLTPGANSVIAGASLFAGGMIHMAFDMILAYNVALLVLESVICVLLGLVFKESKLFDRGEMSKGRMANEQLLSVFIIFGLSVAGMKDIAKMGSVNLAEIICAAAVILAAYMRGISVGACAGACAGIVCSMSSMDMLPIVGIYTLCGFVSGCAKSAGKYAVASAFALGALSLGFMTTMYIYGNVGILNFIIGAVIFCLCPTGRLESLRLFADGYYTSRSDKTYIERLREIMQLRLGELSNTFGALSVSFDELSEKNADATRLNMSQVFDDASGKICRGCGLGSHCWEKEAHITHAMMSSVGKKLNEKGYADILDLPQDFREKCVHAGEFVACVNHFYELQRINALWAGQLEESRRVLSQQYKGFAAVINSLSDEMLADIKSENKYEKKIIGELAKKKLALRSVCVFERADESFEVEAEVYEKEDMQNTDEICEVISGVLKQPMRMTHTLADDLRMIFEPLLRYKMVSGIATLKKDGQTKSGDSYCALSLGDNRYAIAISDGMGSGESAARESEVVINLIKKLLLAGFDKMAALRLINSALVLKNGDEAFATIDLMLADLVTGVAEFVKIGAATGYIKREESIESIFCSTLPAGILTEADIQMSKKRLSHGDVVILVSDGVANAKKNTNWVCEALMGMDADEDADAIAEIILKEAVIHRRGKVDDDMTVIAAKILEK